MTLLLVLLLGAAIGLTLGALGGGGSVLTVPALVYVVGQDAQAATTASLVIVGVASALACLGHARAGHVRWRLGMSFAAAGVGASVLGTRLNAHVSQSVLLTCFATLVLLAAAAMLTTSGASGPAPPEGTTLTRVGTARRTAEKVLVAGVIVGFLTGFLGVGGGFVIVPALVLGLEMPVAVGTSLLVIAVNSGVALALRSGDQSFRWAVIVPFTLAAVVGSAGGRRVGARVSGQGLTRAFAVLLIAVACYVLSQALL